MEETSRETRERHKYFFRPSPEGDSVTTSSSFVLWGWTWMDVHQPKPLMLPACIVSKLLWLSSHSMVAILCFVVSSCCYPFVLLLLCYYSYVITIVL